MRHYEGLRRSSKPPSMNGPSCYKVVTIVLSLCELLTTVMPSTEFTHDHKRVGPADLVKAEHGCLKNFKVRENSIIRTQDSRELGANFLNESDVGNREDCLNLCCKTPFCNVAIFQEKNPFSCYLFDCGDSNDFRCRFTSHISYTSAMLRVNRHQLELGLWSAQHQHESELANLRSSMSESGTPSPPLAGGHPPQKEAPSKAVTENKERGTPTASAPTTTPPSSSSSTAPPTTTPSTQTERKCRRFQFECHSGECLAIYNACDGIPQCQDGSDEGPDLGCPQVANGQDLAPSQESDGANRPPVQGLSRYAWKGQSIPARSNGKDREAFNQRTNLMDFSSRNFANNESPDYGREAGLNYNGAVGKGPGYYDYNQRSQGMRYSGNQMDLNSDATALYQHEYSDYGYAPHQHEHSLQHLAQRHQVSPQQQSLPGGQQYRQRPVMAHGQAWQTPNGRYSYPVDQGASVPLQQPIQMVPQQTPLTHLKPYSEQAIYPPPKMSLKVPGQQGQGPIPADGSKNDPYLTDRNPPPRMSFEGSSETNGGAGMSRTSYNNSSIKKQLGKVAPEISETAPRKPPNLKPTHGVPTNRSLEPGHPHKNESNDQNKSPSEKPPPEGRSQNHDRSPTRKNSTSDIIPSHLSVSHLLEIDLKELEVKEEEMKAEASGAVLALSLGICVTALLVLLVGCRMKSAKRRMRRHRGGKSPLEHDSDYLVNGMYL